MVVQACIIWSIKFGELANLGGYACAHVHTFTPSWCHQSLVRPKDRCRLSQMLQPSTGHGPRRLRFLDRIPPPDRSLPVSSLEQVHVFISGKEVCLSFSKVFKNDLPSCFRPDCDLSREFVRAHCKALSVTFLNAGVGDDRLACLGVGHGLNAEGPEQLGDGMPKITVREMNPWAQSAAITWAIDLVRSYDVSQHRG